MRLIKGYKNDAGSDIILDNDVLLPAQMLSVVNLGKLPKTIPCGLCGIIAPRSSAARKGIFIANCPIDTDYCGDVHAIVYNTGHDCLHYKAGEAFCQLVVYGIAYDMDVEVKKKGSRTTGAFGSTNN